MTGIWTTRTNVNIDVREMEHTHLMNACNAVAKGYVNPDKNHECWVPVGETQCPGCVRFNAYRAKWVAIFDAEVARRANPFKIGQRVRTVAVDNPSTDWEEPGNRKFGVTGRVISESRGHGLCYQVDHGLLGLLGCGWYEPRELEAL
jgi:hypothetical protein